MPFRPTQTPAPPAGIEAKSAHHAAHTAQATLAAELQSTLQPRTPTTPSSEALPATQSDLTLSFASVVEYTTRRHAPLRDAVLLTPRARRQLVAAVVAWMMEADRAATLEHAPHQSTTPPLRAFRAATAAALGGAAPQLQGIWPAFADAVRRTTPNHRWCMDMLDGLESDAHTQGVKSLRRLEEYRYRMGGTMLLLLVSAWGLRDASLAQRTLPLVEKRGGALRMASILQTLRADANAKPPRLSVPRQLLESAALDPHAFLAMKESAKSAGVITHLAGIALEELRQSQDIERALTPGCAKALWRVTLDARLALRDALLHPTRALKGEPLGLHAAHRPWQATLAQATAHTGAWRFFTNPAI